MTTHTQSSHSKARSNDAESMLDGLDVKQELTRAQKAAMKFTDKLVEAGQEHPKTAAVVLLGSGMLLGSLLYGLFAPRPTASQIIGQALQRGAANTGRALLSGLASARKLAN